jgi:hypothetical protein
MDRRTLFLHALALGALLGVVKIAILSAAYGAFGVAALVHAATGVVLWFAAIGVLLAAAWLHRKRAGGFQPYTRVLLHLVVVWAVGQALYTAFSILLFHVLSPGLLEETVEPMRAIARKLGERTGLPSDQVEAHVASITAATSPFSTAGQLRGLRDGMFPGIVLAAIIAIPFRAKGAPVDSATDEPSASGAKR